MPAPVESSAVVVPTAAGEAKPAEAAAVTQSGGGLVLSPLPLSGGRRKTRRLSKKVLKMLKKMPKAKLAKLMKGGQEAEEQVAAEGEGAETGGRKKSRRASRKGKSKKSRHSFLY